ncbi:MAG: CRTAC1 family protein [Acidobacteria bacterium]|nr:CRTAC1 family protein [Acidobacteriota bacterium]
MRFRATVLFPLIAATAALAQPQRIQFRDVTQAAGIRFVHNNGAFGKKYLPETLGPGCAFLDYDNDGAQDILLVNGQEWPGRPQRGSTLKLYRNNGEGRFTDVTRAAGLAVSLYGMGVAVGDYDNDGNTDIFISALGQSRLFRNHGSKTFSDVTTASGLAGPNEFSTGAAWVDYDKDGRLDLIVANYVQWTPATDLFCTLDGTRKSYCTPESYKGASARLWRNLGSGKFADVTQKAGVFDAKSKGLGIAVLDYNQDSWPDLLLANDTEPNKLYLNNGKGGFTEKGVGAGVAFSEDGVARAGMGTDAADYDRSGYPSILISNFSNQMLSLYHNEGNGLFVDEAPRSQVGRNSLLTLGFACFFFDYDLDGWQDIFVANGHIEDEIERIQKRVTYAQAPHVFRNVTGKFEETTQSLGAGFARPRVSRGAAYGDIDNDGDLDLLLTTNGGPALLFRNEGATHRSLRVRLRGKSSNRSGLGAVVTVASGGEKQWQMMRSGSSYLSQSEQVLTFGLGSRDAADTVEVRWPSGSVDRLASVKAGQWILVGEGEKIVSAAPYGAAASARRRPSGRGTEKK